MVAPTRIARAAAKYQQKLNNIDGRLAKKHQAERLVFDAMMASLLGRILLEQTTKHVVVEMIASCFETFTSGIEFMILINFVAVKPTFNLISTCISTRKADRENLTAGMKKWTRGEEGIWTSEDKGSKRKE
jgi:hypothetical protein